MHFDLDGLRPVLLVIDVQELFTQPDAPFANDGAGPMLTTLNAFMADCRGRDIPVVLSSYVLRADLSDAGLLRGNPVVDAGHFSEGSKWLCIDRRLDVADSDIQIRRNRPSAFFGAELDATLRRLGSTVVLLAGLSVNNAISATARDAFARDFPTLVIRECTGAAPMEPASDVYFEILDTWTAEVASGTEVLARLSN